MSEPSFNCEQTPIFSIFTLPKYKLNIDAQSAMQQMMTMSNQQQFQQQNHQQLSFFTTASILPTADTANAHDAALEWLRLIPETFVRTAEARANAAHSKLSQELNKSVKLIIQYILSYLVLQTHPQQQQQSQQRIQSVINNYTIHLKTNALKCLLSWAEFGIPLRFVFIFSKNGVFLT